MICDPSACDAACASTVRTSAAVSDSARYSSSFRSGCDDVVARFTDGAALRNHRPSSSSNHPVDAASGLPMCFNP
jgi:hypothetical protein